MNDMILGWTLMGYGLLGVFITLAVFMLSIKLLVKLFPEKISYDESRKSGR